VTCPFLSIRKTKVNLVGCDVVYGVCILNTHTVRLVLLGGTWYEVCVILLLKPLSSG
jgi:hypothetical protein